MDAEIFAEKVFENFEEKRFKDLLGKAHSLEDVISTIAESSMVNEAFTLGLSTTENSTICKGLCQKQKFLTNL